MIQTRRFLAAAGFLFLAGPLVGAPQEVRSVGLEEVLSIGTWDDGALVQWTALAVSLPGEIYILDALDYAVKKFDGRGHLLKKAGRQGPGPGEFLAPRAVALSGGRLFILDQSRRGIQVFDTELRYKTALPVPHVLSMITPLGSGRLAVSGLTTVGQPARISILDENGRLLGGFSYLDKVEFYLADSIDAVSDGRGSLYLAYFFQDRIEKRAVDGRLAWRWSQKGAAAPELEAIGGDGRGILLPQKTFYKSAALDRFGRLLVLCGGQAAHPSRDVLVFDASGVRRAMFTLPEPSHAIFVDSAGYLYSRANEGLTVKKFRLVYR
jgi:hypothetical protein